MWIPTAHNRLARRGATSIFTAFDTYKREFQALTRQARVRFETRDWHGLQRDSSQRLDLYSSAIARSVTEIRALLDNSDRDTKLWVTIKSAYVDLIRDREDIELAETFFNSVSRRIFSTVGVDRRIEFLFSELDASSEAVRTPIYRRYPADWPLPEVIEAVLTACGFNAPWNDLSHDARLVAEAIEREFGSVPGRDLASIGSIDMVPSVFFRNQGAYLVGRIVCGDQMVPLTLALHHAPDGIAVDAVLLTAEEASIIFSFTRSYFHVEVQCSRELVAFLKSIMPRKPIAELYIALGHNRHGKTELYRDLMGHIDQSTDKLEIARGDRGMVMCVFTLPSFDVVFKVIRDRFAYPKNSTRREVMERYQLVFKHDRAGRLADVQEFEHLAFARSRFSEALLAELASECAETVVIGPRVVEIKHVYVERRMVPLNLYVREAELAAARDAIIDYGQAVRDLAATNIFPGDMLLKNFGVTRHGRVVFYDYDELCLVTDCNFREMPTASDEYDEYGSEPWFYVGQNDIFPEEFINFMGLGGELRESFLRWHRDLLTPQYWSQIQTRHRAGELLDITPYAAHRRLRRAD